MRLILSSGSQHTYFVLGTFTQIQAEMLACQQYPYGYIWMQTEWVECDGVEGWECCLYH